MRNNPLTLLTLIVTTWTFVNPTTVLATTENDKCKSASTVITYESDNIDLSSTAKASLHSISDWFAAGCADGHVILSTPIPEHLGTQSSEWTRAIQRTTRITLHLMDLGIVKDSIERRFPTGELAEQGLIHVEVSTLDHVMQRSQQ